MMSDRLSLSRFAYAAVTVLTLVSASVPAAADQKATPVIAENYRLRVEFRADGAFVETFDGVMTDLTAAALILKDPGKKAQIEKKMGAVAQQATITPNNPANHRTVKYVGDGRFEVHTIATMKLPKPGQKVAVSNHANVFLVSQGDTVAYVHEPLGKDIVNKMDKAELRETATICAVTAFPVVDTDATETPKEPGGCYMWRHDATKDTPLRIVVRRPDAAGVK